ncbi:MAG: prepilin-type N-terminal cleavage/methylation domain-containing protein [Pseudomonadota bacterium]
MTRRVRQGFTLIELGIVIALIALTTAIAIPSFNALSAAGLRTSSSMLAGMIREAYARAAITGKTHRVVFDLDQGAFWLERTEEHYVLSSSKQKADAEGRGGQTLEERKAAREDAVASPGAGASGSAAMLAMLGAASGGLEAMAGASSGMLGMPSSGFGLSADDDLEASLKKQLRRQISFSPVDDDTGKPQKLEGDVRFHRVWIEHQKEGFLKGSAELYFFPTGYTERAIIALSDDEYGERTLTITVNPLTARTAITAEAVEIPRS